MCVLCQEEQVTSPTGPDPDSDALVVACYVGKTTVLSQSKLPGGQCSQSYPESGMRCVPTVTSCGHAMHSKCFQKFYDSLLEGERHNLFRNVAFNVKWQEFICPACQRLCNNVAPLMPALASMNPFTNTEKNDFKTWSAQLLQIITEKVRIVIPGFLEQQTAISTSYLDH